MCKQCLFIYMNRKELTLECVAMCVLNSSRDQTVGGVLCGTDRAAARKSEL